MKINLVQDHFGSKQIARDSIHAQLSEGRKLITPNMARRILEEANYAGQRPARKHHITLLAHIMREGRWASGGQLAFCRVDGKLYLTNGQHRLHAVVEAGAAFEFQILITDCATMAEVDADYHRHDIVARKRSTAEIMNSTGFAAASGLPKTFLTRLYEAAALLDASLGFRQYQSDPIRTRDVDHRISVASQWVAETVVYEEITRPAPPHIRQRLARAGVMAVALVTLRYQPAKAKEFWGGLAEDNGLRRNDPRKALMHDFEERNLSSGSFLQRVIPSITAWNAFYEGRELKLIRVKDASVIAVRGTPVNGKEAV